MEQPPVNEYVDLQIIDCNRQHSVQAKSGNDSNPALFTNELGQGITLNVGDRVAVQGAYISEIGAGADTIELKGRSMDSTKTIKYVEDDINEYDNYPVEIGQSGTRLITDTQLLRSKESTDTFIPKDNETKITCEFYKAASGDGSYIFLPRRWAWDNASETQTDEKLVKYLSDNWTKNDIKELGRNYFEPIVDNNASEIKAQFVSDDYIYVDTSTSADFTEATAFYRLKQDGSRFTLMRAIDQDFYLRENIVEANGSTFAPDLPSGEQPSHYKYKIYREKIDIKVSDGFNSPENIGKEVSAILKKADTPKTFQERMGIGVVRDLSVITKTPTYQPFLCGSAVTLSYDAWYSYAQRRSNQNASDPQLFWNYKSNFYNIYCKRPEIREAGQEINEAGTGYHLFFRITRASRTDDIYTKIPWTEDNLNNLKALFKAQKLYPELFSNYNAQQIQPPSLVNGVIKKHSVEDMRYLHMANNNYGSTLLGDDEEYSLTEPPGSRQSLPIFIYFDNTKEDTFTAGTGDDDLCYGFAKKFTDASDNDSEWIVLTAKNIGGINETLFTFNNVNIEANSRRIGYDWSFGAYGSAYMIAYNGRLYTDYGNTQIWGVGAENRVQQADKDLQADFSTAKELRLNYVGANNPIMSYDPTESRFYFQDLHTPEVIGQIAYGAGDTATIDGVTTPSDNTTDGRARVYKINKRVTKYTYSPDLRPYDSEFTAEYPYPVDNFNDHNASVYERKISYMNRNIQPWAIIDTPCGVFINDFGYTKEQFSTGLWGILGWTYESLQSETTSENNRLQRIDNTNRNQLSIPTTNSDIVSSDTRNYIVNQFGAVYFTQQLPTPSLVGAPPTNNHVKAGRQQYSPPITQSTTSIGLVAPNLPRKMLKPYYCLRSDIIDKPHYLGGEDNEAQLPVVAICDKQYSSTDFIFSSESDYVFTITKKKTITSITTSIHDPNQSFSRVNNDSAVIYKISRNITNRLDISEQIMEETQKNKK
jgi:predicted heme/steroid binding protein